MKVYEEQFQKLVALGFSKDFMRAVEPLCHLAYSEGQKDAMDTVNKLIAKRTKMTREEFLKLHGKTEADVQNDGVADYVMVKDDKIYLPL